MEVSLKETLRGILTYRYGEVNEGTLDLIMAKIREEYLPPPVASQLGPQSQPAFDPDVVCASCHRATCAAGTDPRCENAESAGTYRVSQFLRAPRPVPPGITPSHTIVMVSHGNPDTDGETTLPPVPMCWEHGPECPFSREPVDG